jgi:hypothetical protein
MENTLAEKIFNQITFIAKKFTKSDIEFHHMPESNKLEYINAIKSYETKEAVFWRVAHDPSDDSISVGLAFSYIEHTINIAIAIAKCQLLLCDDLDLNFMHINNAIQVEFSFNPNDFLDKRLEIFRTTIDFFSIVKKQNIAQISENKKVLRPSPIGRIPKKIYYLQKEKISFQRRTFE